MKVLLPVVFAAVLSVALGDEVCCDGVGCFTDDYPFDHFPLPNCVEDIQPLTMRVYTRNNPYDGQNITRDSIPPAYSGLRKTVFLVHGWLGSGDLEWLHDMKDAFLVRGDYNVIIVGWDGGAQNIFYPQSASDTRTVGAEIGLVANNVKENGNSAPERLWCAGHSLGSHVCGHAGNYSHIGRITGMDPAGPGFEYVEDWSVGLNPTCADYVDNIHTNGQAVNLINLGTMRRLGHADFYPHGGEQQPGCVHDAKIKTIHINDMEYPELMEDDTLWCSHMRAVDYFHESVESSCFMVRQADCEDQYELPETCVTYEDPVQSMGYDSDEWDKDGILYIEVNSESRFCQG